MYKKNTSEQNKAALVVFFINDEATSTCLYTNRERERDLS